MIRRSFGGGSSNGMGGGSGGGNVQLIKSVQRAIRTGVGGASQETLSHSNTTTTTASNKTANRREKSNKNSLTLSSSSTPSIFYPQNNVPISAPSTTPPAWPSSPTFSDGSSDWEYVYGFEDDKAQADFVFGTVPSKDEVHHAYFALQEALDPGSPTYTYLMKEDRPASGDIDIDVDDEVTSSTGSMHIASPFRPNKLDWIEPPSPQCSSNMLQPIRYDGVYDAFNLLRNEPSVQRMVVSLSSDRAVWEAVLNNEVVQEIRESFNPADSSLSEKSDEEEGHDTSSNAAKDFLNWMIVNAKAKIMALIDKITKLANDLFRIEEDEKTGKKKAADPFEERLRASFLLSVLVMLVVVVTRTSKA